LTPRPTHDHPQLHRQGDRHDFIQLTAQVLIYVSHPDCVRVMWVMPLSLMAITHHPSEEEAEGRAAAAVVTVAGSLATT
jgi:hypothetical protein